MGLPKVFTFLFFLGYLAPLAFAQQGPCGSEKQGTIACLTVNAVVQAIHGFNPNLPLPPVNVPSGDSVLATPLVASVPVPSPASGIIYTFDNSAGAFVRSSQSFGPILAERADTIGRRKLFVGFAFQRFVFDKLDGVSLHSLGTDNIDLQLNQFTLFANYGVTSRFDISLALPYSTVHGSVTFNSVVPNPLSGGVPSNIPISARVSHTASGIGDVNLQFKGTVLRGENAALALGAKLRLPTGDDYEVLGAGAAGITPFLAGNVTYKRVSPHVNLGYQVNGKSILTGNILTGEKRYIPNQVQYATGVDLSAARRVTLVFDILGSEVIHGDRFDRGPKPRQLRRVSALPQQQVEAPPRSGSRFSPSQSSPELRILGRRASHDWVDLLLHPSPSRIVPAVFLACHTLTQRPPSRFEAPSFTASTAERHAAIASHSCSVEGRSGRPALRCSIDNWTHRGRGSPERWNRRSGFQVSCL
jgi:hypothetical protein